MGVERGKSEKESRGAKRTELSNGIEDARLTAHERRCYGILAAEPQVGRSYCRKVAVQTHFVGSRSVRGGKESG